jgi:hypothetical protein
MLTTILIMLLIGIVPIALIVTIFERAAQKALRQRR